MMLLLLTVIILAVLLIVPVWQRVAGIAKAWQGQLTVQIMCRSVTSTE